MSTRRVAFSVLAAVAAAVLTGCAAGTVAGVPSPAAPRSAAPVAVATTAPPSDAANRRVCVDLDARGGQLYSTLVVPMMAGLGGQKSIEVDIAAINRATAQVAQIGSDGALNEASGAVADEGERLVAAAKAFQAVNNVEGTALLTAHVGLSVACTNAGHKPSWFDPAALAAN